MRVAGDAIVASGIDLYELRPDAASCATLVTIDGGCSLQRIFGLHAKSFVFDATTLYVGSMNLNMRSAYLNAESALIIDSPELAGSVARRNHAEHASAEQLARDAAEGRRPRLDDAA